MRLFVAEPPRGDWSELTDGAQRTVRVAARDLQHARRTRARIRSQGEDVAVILDVTVSVAPDVRSATRSFQPHNGVSYAGTIDGLAGLISDIGSADVADGVTLVAASPRQDLRELGRDVLQRLRFRDQARAS